MKVDKSLTGLFIDLVMTHYGFIEHFKDNNKYIYKGNSILYKKNEDIYSLNYTLTNTTEDNEYRENYRTDTVFNQEPRLLKTW